MRGIRFGQVLFLENPLHWSAHTVRTNRVSIVLTDSGIVGYRETVQKVVQDASEGKTHQGLNIQPTVFQRRRRLRRSLSCRSSINHHIISNLHSLRRSRHGGHS